MNKCMSAWIIVVQRVMLVAGLMVVSALFLMGTTAMSTPVGSAFTY